MYSYKTSHLVAYTNIYFEYAKDYTFSYYIVAFCLLCQLLNSTRAWPIRSRIHYPKHVATIETMSELKLIHALLPLQLGMAICYQYESAYRIAGEHKFSRITNTPG